MDVGFTQEELDQIEALKAAQAQQLRTQLVRALAGGVAGAAGVSPGALNGVLPTSKVTGLPAAQAEQLIQSYRGMQGQGANALGQLEANLAAADADAVGAALESGASQFKELAALLEGTYGSQAGMQGQVAAAEANALGELYGKLQLGIAEVAMSGLTLDEGNKNAMLELAAGMAMSPESPDAFASQEFTKLYSALDDVNKTHVARWFRSNFPQQYARLAAMEDRQGGGAARDMEMRAKDASVPIMRATADMEAMRREIQDSVKRARMGQGSLDNIMRFDQMLKATTGKGLFDRMDASEAAAIKDAVSNPAKLTESPAFKAIQEQGANVQEDIDRIKALEAQDGRFRTDILKDEIKASGGFQNYRKSLSDAAEGAPVSTAEALRQYIREGKGALRRDLPMPSMQQTATEARTGPESAAGSSQPQPAATPAPVPQPEGLPAPVAPELAGVAGTPEEALMRAMSRRASPAVQ